MQRTARTTKRAQTPLNTGSILSCLSEAAQPLCWRWMTAPNSTIPLPMRVLAGIDTEASIRVVQAADGCFICKNEAGDTTKYSSRDATPWGREMIRRFMDNPADLLVMVFPEGLLVTWSGVVQQRWNLSQYAEFALSHADTAQRESQFSHRIALSARDIRFSSAATAAAGIAPGTPMHLTTLKGAGTNRLLLTSMALPGSVPVDAWKSGYLTIAPEWLGSRGRYQSLIQVTWLRNRGLVVIPTRYASARAPSPAITTGPCLDGFTPIGQRSASVIVFRRGLRCAEVPQAVLGAAGMVAGDTLATSLLPGGGLVIRKSPDGHQRIRVTGAAIAFRLNTTNLNLGGIRDRVRFIACKDAVLALDSSFELPDVIPELEQLHGDRRMPVNRTYPRPEGRLQLSGAWLKAQGLEVGMRYKVDLHRRGVCLHANDAGPYVVTGHGPLNDTPKVYVPADYLAALNQQHSTVGVVAFGQGRLLLVSRR